MEYCEYPETIVKQLESNVETGLTSEQVKERAEKYGPNKLKEKKKTKTTSQYFWKELEKTLFLLA